MPTLVTLSGDLADLVVVDFDPRRTKVWLEANTDAIVDQTNNVIRLGNAKATLAADGTFSFANVIASSSTDINVENLQYALKVDYQPKAGGPRKVETFGWWTVNASANVAALVAEQYLEPSFLSTARDEIQGYVDQAEQLVGIDTSDAAVAYVAEFGGTTPGVLDAQTAANVADDSSSTGAAVVNEIATRAVAVEKFGGLLPTTMGSAVTAAPLGASEPIVADYFNGVVYGSRLGDVYTSTNAGASWTLLCPGPAGGTILALRPTDDGQALAVTSSGVYKSAGWGTGTVTWAQKVANNGAAAPQRFCFDGNGTKFIVSQYGAGSAGSAAWIDSRYAYISTDAGNTWTQAWDSAAVLASLADSHVHGVCYDPWSDRFYVSEGHSAAAGIYHSTNNGATWSLAPGMSAASAGQSASPTVICATDDGLVCGGDSTHSQGMFGVLRTIDPSAAKLVQTWAWRTNRSSNNGWGQFARRDPNTGMVYIAWKSQANTVAPIITGGTAASGALVWEWPDDGSGFALGDHLDAVVVDDTGRTLAFGQKGGSFYKVTGGKVGRPVARNSVDTGGIGGGLATDSTSTAVGAKSTTGANVRAVAIGAGANCAAGDSVAIGTDVQVVAESTVLVGYAATGGSSNTVAVGRGATTVGAATVAIGAGASATAGNATAVGRSAVAAISNTAIGYQATASTGSSSVALGAGTATTGSNQVALGSRHIELAEMTEPAAPGVDGARLYVKDNGAGKTQLCVRFNTGAIAVIATQP